MNFDLTCSIYLYELLRAQVGQKEVNDKVSRDYCYLYVNIIRTYMCLGSNHQLWSRGPTMFAVNIRSSAWFQAWFIRSYIQTAESRINVVEGTAQETVWEDGDLVWRRGRAQHIYFPSCTVTNILHIYSNIIHLGMVVVNKITRVTWEFCRLGAI